ncbi:GNAT family N-acetyltransferase [Streptomyces libani]|uniref:GNAT family N-acetyltransferase n=1 Tax=Streptomyces TaxID=1883 RepID=UPI0022535423|nr:GNAT family N-acetyltransferase [Streptomyces libani]MCX5451106.1 GNAT family N-acetyltransferase [Streptomyces libani]MCX5451400.1 GNAT family N-acetyltransferase [Streptomyces libani]
MNVRFDLDPSLTPELHDGICALWADVSNAGGAVGFVPPVTREDVRPELLKHLTAMAEGRQHLVAGRGADGRVLATAFLTTNSHRLMKHWLWVYTVMVHPSLQGRGTGRRLMTAVADAARSVEGVTALRLTCRGGSGARPFYEACGYQEVGRVPGAIRVADDDYRDDITMWLDLG